MSVIDRLRRAPHLLVPKDLLLDFKSISYHIVGFNSLKGRLRLSGLGKSGQRRILLGLSLVAVLLLFLIDPNLIVRGGTVYLYSDRARVVPVGIAAYSFALTAVLTMLAIDLVVQTRRRFLYLIAAAAFLLIGANLAEDPLAYYPPSVGTPFSSEALWRQVTQISYLATIALLLAAALLQSPRVRRLRIDVLLRISAVLSTGLFFGALLWEFLQDPLHNWGPIIGSGIEGGLLSLTITVFILFLLTSTALVRLFYGIGQSITEIGSRRLTPCTAKTLLAILIAVEMYFVGWNNHGFLVSLLTTYRVTAIEYALVSAGFVLAAVFLNRVYRNPGIELDQSDKITNTIEAIWVFPFLIGLFLSGAGKFLEGNYTRVAPLSNTLIHVSDRMLKPIVLYSAYIFVIPIFYWFNRLRKKDIAPSVRARYVGYVLIAFWFVVVALLSESLGPPMLDQFDFNMHTPADYFLPLILTAVVGTILIVRWKYLDVRQAGFLGAVVLLGWLFGSRGSPLTDLGRVISPNTNLLIVVGVSLTLLTGSEFANRNGRWLTRSSRSVLWVLYLGLSLIMALWISDTSDGVNELQIGASGLTAFAWLYVAFPFALWLVIADRFRPNQGVVERGTSDAETVASKANQEEDEGLDITQRSTREKFAEMFKHRMLREACLCLGAVTIGTVLLIHWLPPTPKVPPLMTLRAPGLFDKSAAKPGVTGREVSVGLGPIFTMPVGWKVTQVSAGSAVVKRGMCSVGLNSSAGLMSVNRELESSLSDLDSHSSIPPDDEVAGSSPDADGFSLPAKSMFQDFGQLSLVDSETQYESQREAEAAQLFLFENPSAAASGIFLLSQAPATVYPRCESSVAEIINSIRQPTFNDAAELAALRLQLPSGLFTGECESDLQVPPISGALAALNCAQNDSPVSDVVTFQFARASDLNAAFSQLQAGHSIEGTSCKHPPALERTHRNSFNSLSLACVYDQQARLVFIWKVPFFQQLFIAPASSSNESPQSMLSWFHGLGSRRSQSPR